MAFLSFLNEPLNIFLFFCFFRFFLGKGRHFVFFFGGKNYVSEHDIGFGKIGQPVRAALTGGAPSPDLSWVLTLLGKEETLARLEDVMNSDFAKELTSHGH